MPETFLTFKRFNDADAANDLITHLKNFHIPYEVEDSDKFFDPTFARDPLQRDIFIKLQPKDFAIAQKQIENYYKEQLKNVTADYYLFEFQDEELQDILMKPDEWGDFDNQLAQQILKDRGREMKPTVVEELKKQRNDYLAKPAMSGGGWIPAGFLSSFIGGFIGIFIGWHLYQSKKTLPDGRSVYMFKEEDRRNGKIIFIIGCIVFPLILILRFLFPINEL